jgi:hypothetical protein
MADARSFSSTRSAARSCWSQPKSRRNHSTSKACTFGAIEPAQETASSRSALPFVAISTHNSRRKNGHRTRSTVSHSLPVIRKGNSTRFILTACIPSRYIVRPPLECGASGNVLLLFCEISVRTGPKLAHSEATAYGGSLSARGSKQYASRNDDAGSAISFCSSIPHPFGDPNGRVCANVRPGW